MDVPEIPWVTVGAGFDASDDLDTIHRFMANLGRAGHALERCVGDSREPRVRKASINLICHQRAAPGDPDITPAGRGRDGSTFAVAYDWLTGRFLDEGTGPWQILAVLALALVTICHGEAIPLPPLPAPPRRPPQP